MALENAPRRFFPRFPITVPIDVIALRSGVPENLPGRCADLSEGGVGAIVAGQLINGQQVAVELRLPNVGVPVRARALVRHQGKMRYGFEFVGLSLEQREKIRYWVNHVYTPPTASEEKFVEAPKAKASANMAKKPVKVRARRRPLLFFLILFALLALAAVGWWQWQRSWSELETGQLNRTINIPSADISSVLTS